MTGPEFQTLDDGKLVAGSEFVAVLRDNDLDQFEKVMSFMADEVMRSVPGRSTVRIKLKTESEATLTAYLKRYEREYLSSGKCLLRWLRWPGAEDEAGHEWKMIQRLRTGGFNTATPIALGQERKFGIVQRSFLLTAEITGGVAAHEYLREVDAHARREMLMRIGALSGQFHRAGFIHKDYYLSHLFIVGTGDAAELYFIDLQRLLGPRRFHPRWRIKDLGALAYSAQKIGASPRDLLRAYHSYSGVEKLSRSDKEFIRRVVARAQALHRRGPKYDVIWDRPGVRPRNV